MRCVKERKISWRLKADEVKLVESVVKLAAFFVKRNWRFAQQHGIDRDELHSICLEAILRMPHYHKSSGNAPSTVAMNLMKWALQKQIKRRRMARHRLSFITSWPQMADGRPLDLEDVSAAVP